MFPWSLGEKNDIFRIFEVQHANRGQTKYDIHNSDLMSFMDGFSSYNHIKMASKDMTKATFTIEWGIYCSTVMLFKLKNVGVIYQRMAISLLHDMMHNKVVMHVDDMC